MSEERHLMDWCNDCANNLKGFKFCYDCLYQGNLVTKKPRLWKRSKVNWLLKV